MESNILIPSASEPYKFNTSKYAGHIIKINLERENVYILNQAMVSDRCLVSEIYCIPLTEKQ